MLGLGDVYLCYVIPTLGLDLGVRLGSFIGKIRDIKALSTRNAIWDTRRINWQYQGGKRAGVPRELPHGYASNYSTKQTPGYHC